MFCRHCGKEIDENSKFCTYCGKKTNDLSSSYESSADEKKPHERWSWGAFGLGWIYFCGMKYKYWGWLFVLGMITNGLQKNENAGVIFIGFIIWLIAVIIFGAKGRQLAWESREWKSEKEFVAVQKKWDIWGTIIFIILNGIWLFIPTS